MEDSLHERGRAIEDLFFKQCDDKLLENLRKEATRKEIYEAFQHVSGITDHAALDALIEAGITPESLHSLALVPLIMVAWADKTMDPPEKAAILEAAESAGVRPGSASYASMNPGCGKSRLLICSMPGRPTFWRSSQRLKRQPTRN